MMPFTDEELTNIKAATDDFKKRHGRTFAEMFDLDDTQHDAARPLLSGVVRRDVRQIVLKEKGNDE